MEVLIFTIYLVLLSFALTRIPFVKNSALKATTIIFLFVIKVAAGLAYAKFYSLPKYYPGSDTFRFFRLSLAETDWLLKDPIHFIKDLFSYGYTEAGSVLSSKNSYWNDLKSNLIIKMLAVANVFTAKSYYADIILFNFLFFFGLIGLYRFFDHLFPGSKAFVLAALFLLPSTLFWCSGIHKDGLLLSAVGLIIFYCQTILKNQPLLKHLFVLAICSLLVFALRNYVLFALLPAMFAWLICLKTSFKPFTVFFTTYFLGSVLFFTLPAFTKVDLPSFVANRRLEFLQLEAGSVANSFTLEPSFKSFAIHLPETLDMAFLRPHISELKSPAFFPTVLENLMLIALFIFFLYRLSRGLKASPAVLFLLFFGCTILLICGYTIPFSGAIVRYRSLVLPIVITPLLLLSIKRKEYIINNYI